MISTLSRQVSASTRSEPVVCKLCENEISCQPGHLRLSCRCLIHYNCLVKYIIYCGKLSDRESRENRGVRCPFSYTADDKSDNSCAQTEALGTPYYLSLDDLYNLVDYGELLKSSSAPEDLLSTHQFQALCAPIPGLFDYLKREFSIDNVSIFSSKLESCESHVLTMFPSLSLDALRALVPANLRSSEQDRDFVLPHQRSRSASDPEGQKTFYLTRDQVQGLQDWIEGGWTPIVIQADDLSPYMRATMTFCPKCGIGGTRYHGHECHHLTEGCKNPDCKTWYCMKCRCTSEINVAAGRGPRHCKCMPTIFCGEIKTQKDVDKFIKMNECGYPADTRCGCPICSSCRPGKPCEYCNGKCAVCQDMIMSGPTEVDTTWIAQSPEQIAKLKVADTTCTTDAAEASPVALGRVGQLIVRLRERLAEIQELPEDYRNEMEVVVGMADLSRIIDFLAEMNDDESSPKETVAMMEVRLQEQEDQLARMFESGTSDEAAIQRQLEKIERTQREIGRGGEKPSKVPSIDIFEHNFDQHIQKVQGQDAPTMHKGELNEYQQYGDFLESHSRRRRKPKPVGGAANGCDESCSLGHANDGECLECGEGWNRHSGHNCQDGSRGSWPVHPPPPPGGCNASICSLKHINDGNCIVCGNNWGSHSGHNCSGGTRGSWPIKPPPPGGCDANCTSKHTDGNCLLCGKGWSNHSGHNCTGGTVRGSWPVKDTPTKGGKAKHTHPGCAALRPTQRGNNTCRTCGGHFQKCSGSYGHRDVDGTGYWRPGPCPKDLSHSPESPNTSWCSEACERFIAPAGRGGAVSAGSISTGHDITEGVQCVICSNCSFCSGYGAKCVNCVGKNRSDDKGNICGCGHGRGSCRGCGMCKTCCDATDTRCTGAAALPVPSDADKVSSEPSTTLDVEGNNASAAGAAIGGIGGGKSSGAISSPARVHGCDTSCTSDHFNDGNCLVCKEGWGLHLGHTCRNSSNRGSWLVGQGQKADKVLVRDFHRACLCGDVGKVHGILTDARFPVINRRGDHGRTALHVAAGANREDVVTVLLQNGADIHLKDRRNWSALHEAAHASSENICQILLDAGASKAQKDNKGSTPYDVALRNHADGLVLALLSESSILHPGKMQCRCFHNRGDLSWPLTSGDVHLNTTCLWSCCRKAWNSTTCGGSS